jgi:hypothetical protein
MFAFYLKAPHRLLMYVFTKDPSFLTHDFRQIIDLFQAIGHQYKLAMYVLLSATKNIALASN